MSKPSQSSPPHAPSTNKEKQYSVSAKGWEDLAKESYGIWKNPEDDNPPDYSSI